MVLKRVCAFLIALLASGLFIASNAGAATLSSLPMDTCEPGPAPKDSAYLSATEYQDESITVKIYQDRYANTDYIYAHIKITHPSQLRTAPASMVEKSLRPESVNFKCIAETENRGRNIASAANAVIAINGDFFTKTDKCQVVLRQSQQVRNAAEGYADVLVIDKNGDFSILKQCTKADYKAYWTEHSQDMYNVLCFGPVLVENGKCVISRSYKNGYIGAEKGTQRSAIAQLGPLEYMIITCSSDQASNYADKQQDKGMTIREFAKACEIAGKRLSENGCILAYNLDGGNSATLVFKLKDEKENLVYSKYNPGQERTLSDIIYFATLVK